MKRLLLTALLTLAFVLVTARTLAAVEAFSLSWWTVSGGGGAASGAGQTYQLQGSAGQPAADLSQGGDFTVASGFLGGASAPPADRPSLFLPLIVR